MPRYRDGWFKVSRRLIESSLWAEDPVTLKVFLALLEASQQPGCMRRGTVIISRPILAGRCLISVEQLDAAITTLAGPDPESRTKGHEGRRLEVLSNGFRVVNYGVYHDRKAEEALSKARRAAGQAGGEASAEGRKNQQDTQQQKPSKPQPKGKQTGDRRRETGNGDGNNGETTTDFPAQPETKALALAKAPSWSKEAATLWDVRFGLFSSNPGRIGKALAPLVKGHGWEKVKPAWQRYLAEKEPEFCSPNDFAGKFLVWAGEAAPAKGKQTKGQELAAMAARFIARGEPGGGVS
jgi:hypothetical protein